MKAIFKKEFRSYFCSPVGYVFIAIFFLVASLFFAINNLVAGYGDINVVFANMTMIFVFLTPVITMRLIAEEKNSKTDQLLLTAPVKVTSIVLGKFLAAVSVLLIAMALTVIYPLLLIKFTTPSWSKLIGNYVGFLLMGAAFVAIGLYISALTENQIIAAVVTFGVLFLLYLAETFGVAAENEVVRKIIGTLSITNKFNDFSLGIIDLKSVVYYLSIVVLFVFLSVSHIEKRRWSK